MSRGTEKICSPLAPGNSALCSWVLKIDVMWWGVRSFDTVGFISPDFNSWIYYNDLNILLCTVHKSLENDNSDGVQVEPSKIVLGVCLNIYIDR